MQGLENFETGSPILRSDGIREICLVLGVDCCLELRVSGAGEMGQALLFGR